MKKIFDYPVVEGNDMSDYIIQIPIILEKRGDDWRAYVKDKSDMFVTGISASEVLDKLLGEIGLY